MSKTEKRPERSNPAWFAPISAAYVKAGLRPGPALTALLLEGEYPETDTPLPESETRTANALRTAATIADIAGRHPERRQAVAKAITEFTDQETAQVITEEIENWAAHRNHPDQWGAPTKTAQVHAQYWEFVREAYDVLGVDRSELTRELLGRITETLNRGGMSAIEFQCLVNESLILDLFEQGPRVARFILSTIADQPEPGPGAEGPRWIRRNVASILTQLATDEAYNREGGEKFFTEDEPAEFLAPAE